MGITGDSALAAAQGLMALGTHGTLPGAIRETSDRTPPQTLELEPVGRPGDGQVLKTPLAT